MFWKKKAENAKPKTDSSKFERKLEFNNKNIDIAKLTKQIENFLKNSNNSYDLVVYSIHEFPEKKLKIFKIEYGVKNPTMKFVITIEGDENSLKIFDHIPEDCAAWLELEVFRSGFFQNSINVTTYYNKLWEHIEKTATLCIN